MITFSIKTRVLILVGEFEEKIDVVAIAIRQPLNQVNFIEMSEIY